MNPTVPERPAAGGVGTPRFSTIELLAALVLLFVVTPFIQDLPHGDLIEVVLLTLVLVSALVAVGGCRRTLVAAVVLLTPALAGKWFDHFQPSSVLACVFLGAGLVFISFVVVNLFQFILHAPQVNADVLCAGISTYLMIGLLWAFTYVLVGRLSPGAFMFNATSAIHPSMEGFNAFYFSFITLSTVGFGDVTPVSKVARTLTVMEAVVGMFYMTILIARLVSLYSTSTCLTGPDETRRKQQ
jgi:hypothetical protein